MKDKNLPQNKDISYNANVRLLIADDDFFIRSTLCEQFTAEGFSEIFEVSSLAEFKKVFVKADPDLILLSLEMDFAKVIDLCTNLRVNGFLKPIILLMPTNTEGNVVKGLEAGANDYITKPFRVNDLLYLVREELAKFRKFTDTLFEIDTILFDTENKLISDLESSKTQKLTEKEVKILKTLVSVFPHHLTKEQLLRDVWGFQDGVSTHTLETHIYRLRQKLVSLSNKNLILTTEHGYCLFACRAAKK